MKFPDNRLRLERTGRIALVIGALCFGLAALLSILAPVGIDLGEWILMLDPGGLVWLQAHVGPGLWRGVVGPVLVRPVWLLPVMAGTVALAAAWTARQKRALS